MGHAIYHSTDFYPENVDGINRYITALCENLLTLEPSILTLSSDVGQHQWGTLTTLPSQNYFTPYAWNIFKFDDGNGVIFIKFEYFMTNSGFVGHTIRVTCGKNTDGAGTILNILLDKVISFPLVSSFYTAGNSQTLYHKNRMVCREGFLAISLAGSMLSSPSKSNIFALSRPVDQSGSVVSNKIIVYTTTLTDNTGATTWGSNSFRLVYNLDDQSLVSSNQLSEYGIGYELTGMSQLNSNGEIRFSRMLVRAPEFLYEPNIIISKKSGYDWDTLITPEGQGGPVFSEWGCFGSYGGVDTIAENPHTGFVRWE